MTALRVVLPFLAGYFLSYVYRAVNAVLAPLLVGEFAISAQQLGFLTGVYFFSFGLFQIPLGVLLTTERRGKAFTGRTFWLYMLLYGINRFIVELFRGDQRGEWLGLATSQLVSAAIVPKTEMTRVARRSAM